VANLHAPTGVRIYYAASAVNGFNSYLMDKTYILDGGGLFLPATVPEPNVLLLAMLGVGFIRVWRRTRATRSVQERESIRAK